MPVDSKRAEAVFLAAVEHHDPDERAAVLDRECASDADLRLRVEDLLRAQHDTEKPELPSTTAAGMGGSARTRSRLRLWSIRWLKILGLLLVLWLASAYLILPAAWRHYEHHPALAAAPKTTLTAQGIPGDPLNVGLIGSEHDLVESMLAAGWHPADPITIRSSLRIAGSVVFKRSYPDAPVSSLYLFGRPQDLAFEKAFGNNARRRHHVRFWKSVALGRHGVPLFIGAATFDVSVGFSRDTGQVTHHISPDVDAQRDELIADLVAAGRLTKIYQVTGVGATLFGWNGGGDRYYTDGELTLGVLAIEAVEVDRPERLPNPPLVRSKDQLWAAIRSLLEDTSQ